MSDSPKAALAASIAVGYLLGRSSKGKLALAVATYMASGRLQTKPQELLAAGVERIGDSPQLSQLADQVRSELMTVGREALKAAFDRRLGTFADSLADRTKALNGAVPGAADEEEEEEEEEPEGEPDEEPERERPSARSGESGKSRREGGERAAPPQKSAKKTATAKKAQAKKAPPEKTAKKTTTAKKTASKPPTEQRRRRR